MKGNPVKRSVRKNKPSKGMRQFMKQTRRSIEKAMASVAKAVSPQQAPMMSRHAARNIWLSSHSRSKYRPHQGVQECERRLRQREAGIIA